MPPTTPAERRFWSYVPTHDDPDVCWEWAGAKAKGYGQFHLGMFNGKARMVRAHRFAYELLVAPIPDGLTIDHVCRNRSCVNPAHMEPVSGSENASRGNQTDVCKKAGHPLTEDNVIRRPSKPGERECRTCARDRNRRWLERRSA